MQRDNISLCILFRGKIIDNVFSPEKVKERLKEELENDTLKIHPIYDCQKGKIYFMDSEYLNIEYQGDKPIFKIPLSAQMYDIGEDECDD